MKQIKVKDDVWEKLSRKKIDLKVRSLSDVISKMLKLINKLKLTEELKAV